MFYSKCIPTKIITIIRSKTKIRNAECVVFSVDVWFSTGMRNVCAVFSCNDLLCSKALVSCMWLWLRMERPSVVTSMNITNPYVSKIAGYDMPAPKKVHIRKLKKSIYVSVYNSK